MLNTVASVLLAATALPAYAHANAFNGLYEPWDSPKDKGTYRDFRLKCEDLVWGFKAPVDVSDKKAIAAIYAEKITAFKKSKTADSAFYLICAMAQFGPNSDAEIAIQLQSYLSSASGFRSFEFTRVAYAANVMFREMPLPKTNVQKGLFAKRKDDPLVMHAAIAGADFERGYTEVHRQALVYAQSLYDMYPKRREKYRCILALPLEMCWFRSGWWAKKPVPEYYERAMKLIEEALADPQTSKDDRLGMESTKKFMIGIKSRVEGGG